MAFANYAAFRTAVLKLIDGDNVNSQSIDQDTLDLLIQLGEARVYRELRCSAMEAPLSVTVAGGEAAIPDDLIELKIAWFDPDQPLEIVSETDLRKRSRSGGDVRQVAQAGESLIFLPAATDGQVLEGRYYQRPADLKTGPLPATFTRYGEVYLYAALAESAPFIGDDDRIPMWNATYQAWLDSANTQERNRVYSGSRLRQKAR